MKIEFGSAKDEANRAKHGVSLAAAAEIDIEQARIEEDRRFVERTASCSLLHMARRGSSRRRTTKGERARNETL
jgi:uncharacterized DUF497 family protein